MRVKSRNAIKCLYDANPFYVHMKKHFCPECGSRLVIRHMSEIVNSESPEARDYDFSVGDTNLVGDVEFRKKYFYCSQCELEISFRKMKLIERGE